MNEQRVAIVTGGSLGIGLAVVQAFAAKGIRVAALARDLGRLEQAIAGIEGAVGIAADVSKEAEVTRATVSPIACNYWWPERHTRRTRPPSASHNSCSS